VRWTISQASDHTVETVVEFDAEQARLEVDARAASGSFLDNLSMEANVIDPEGNVINLALPQVAPGRYEANFTPTNDGAYFIRVAGHSISDETVTIGQTSGWVLGYSPEYQVFDADQLLLETVATLADGRDLTGDIGAAFDHTLPGEETARPVWPWLTLLATILLPFDIAVRRLVIGRQDVARAWAATLGRLRLQTAQQDAGRTEQVARLFQAKARATTQQAREVESGVEAMPPTATWAQEAGSSAGSAARPEPEQRPVPEAKPRATPPPARGGTLASRLLEKKKEQDRKPDDEA